MCIRQVLTIDMDCPEICYTDKAALKLTEIHMPLLLSAGIKALWNTR